MDWEAIESGLVDEIQIKATNYGLIAAHNLTYNWMRYWRNSLFILPDEETNKSRERNVGTLEANSTITFPIQIQPLLEYDIPIGWGELRDGNDVTLARDNSGDDPNNFDVDIIVIPGDDPDGGQYFVKHTTDGLIQFIYYYGTGTLYVPEYNETGDVIDLVTTPNASFPEGRRLVAERITRSAMTNKKRDEIDSAQQTLAFDDDRQRRLERCTIEDLADPCEVCRKAKWGAKKVVCHKVKYLKYCDAKWNPLKTACGWVTKKVCEEGVDNLPDPCAKVCSQSEFPILCLVSRNRYIPNIVFHTTLN